MHPDFEHRFQSIELKTGDRVSMLNICRQDDAWTCGITFIVDDLEERHKFSDHRRLGPGHIKAILCAKDPLTTRGLHRIPSTSPKDHKYRGTKAKINHDEHRPGLYELVFYDTASLIEDIVDYKFLSVVIAGRNGDGIRMWEFNVGDAPSWMG